jgi:chorismate mutase
MVPDRQSTSGELDAIRNRIDAVDSEIGRLLAERFNLVMSTVEHKYSGTDDAPRIDAILWRMRSQAEALGVEADAVDTIYRVIIDQGLKLQADRQGSHEIGRNLDGLRAESDGSAW